MDINDRPEIHFNKLLWQRF